MGLQNSHRTVGRRHGAGRMVLPIRNLSTAAAQARPFGDGPDDERLAAAGVAGDEDALGVGHVVAVAGHVAAAVEVGADLLGDPGRLGAGEAQGQEAPGPPG